MSSSDPDKDPILRDFRDQIAATDVELLAAVNKRVEVLLLIGNGSCKLSFDNRVSTVTVGTSMLTYDVDISRTIRDKVLAIELAPTTVDATEYYVDDISLVP